MLWVTFCEFASIQQDNTFSAMRGGLCEWKVKTFPATMSVYALGHITQGSLENGEHKLECFIETEKHNHLWEAGGLVQVTNQKYPINFSFPINCAILSFGTYVLRVKIEGKKGRALKAEWKFSFVDAGESQPT